MKVRLLEIDESPARFHFEISRNELQKLEQRFDFEILSCEAQLTKSIEFVKLQGRYRVQISTECDRCLQPAVLNLDEAFTLDLVAEGGQQDLTGDTELSSDFPEIDYYRGDEIFLTRYFEDQLILDLPLTITCAEDCKGLCSTCGGNLNKKRCDCHEKEGKSPFSILKDLKSDS